MHLRPKQYNDPIYGFISIPTPLISDLIQEPIVQRLRRIKQMGLSYLVFPGAQHDRFQHALGALHLMTKAIQVLRSKKILISDTEAEAVQIAILLHDIGHGPFSHALEGVISTHRSHEELSIILMESLNEKYLGKLNLAIQMFKDQYTRPFFYQLIASQLDMDRLDYLKRDSFYTGVPEGNINTERILSMLNVSEDRLGIDLKGIHSVEKFLLARRLMYMSVYLHKTSYAAEEILIRIFKRAQFLHQKGVHVNGNKTLHYFLNKNSATFSRDSIQYYCELDDHDVMYLLKQGQAHSDFIFSSLCKQILNRKLPKIEISNSPVDESNVMDKQKSILNTYPVDVNDVSYFTFQGKIEIKTYNHSKHPILMLDKKGNFLEIDSVSDQFDAEMLRKTSIKYYWCYPKTLE